MNMNFHVVLIKDVFLQLWKNEALVEQALTQIPIGRQEIIKTTTFIPII